MKKIKAWLTENGFMGLASLVVAGVAFVIGWKFLLFGSLGFFAGKNWEIIRKLWNEKYKDGVEDFIEDFKDKVTK